MANRTGLRKKLSYWLPDDGQNGFGNVASMADHWRGFTWQCGPVVVKWLSETYPQVQVWASSVGEGQRVVRHALSHMGADETQGQWQAKVCSSNRYGRIATVQATLVSARGGPHGVGPSQWIL